MNTDVCRARTDGRSIFNLLDASASRRARMWVRRLWWRRTVAPVPCPSSDPPSEWLTADDALRDLKRWDFASEMR